VTADRAVATGASEIPHEEDGERTSGAFVLGAIMGQPSCGCGVALIILGALALTSQGITYTTREKVIDLRPLKAWVDAVGVAEHHSSLEARSPEPSRCSRGSLVPS
jgi:hypothetical protein